MQQLGKRTPLQKLLSRAAGLMVVGLFASATTCQPSAVIGYNVNTTDDFSDDSPGDARCEGGPHDECSLRAAVEEVNRRGVFSTINIPAGTYELNGDLVLTRGQTIEIIGEGRDETIIRQTSPVARIFSISGVEHTVLIKGVTLTGGNTGPLGRGGAINFLGDGGGRWRPKLEMENCRVSENNAGFWGGGIYASGEHADVEIVNCVIERNASSPCGGRGGGESGGGGIMVSRATLKLIGSEVRDNCGSNGGGIRILNSENNLIMQSTIAGNISISRAGGVYTSDASGQIIVSTIAGNNGREVSGLLISGGHFEVRDVTIADNNSSNQLDVGENFSNLPDVVALQTRSGADVSLQNTIVARNPYVSEPGDCAGSIESQGGNLIGKIDPSAVIPCNISTLPTDQVDTGIFILGLGELEDNGGGTRTMTPAFNEQLHDNGVPGCWATDQIGFSDPSRVVPSGAACDIGAVEIQ